MPGHIPVLLPEVLSTFNLKPNQTVIDATVGAGGHAQALLEAISPNGRLLGIEADRRTLKLAQQNLAGYGARAHLVQGSFRDLRRIAADAGFDRVDAILFDLGLSAMDVEDPERGFSFLRDGPLDMRFNPDQGGLMAADLVNSLSKDQLAEIFRSLGEERAAVVAAHAIVVRRREKSFTRTTDLAQVMAEVIHRRGRRHPATRIFQALRMKVNDELGALQDSLPQALDLLATDGRLAVISYHSLEDRIVKLWMREMAKTGRGQMTPKKGQRPTYAERQRNIRARSAFLRILTKQKP